MKRWLPRVAVDAALRGKRGTPAWFARWFPGKPIIDDRAFQGPDEPYPGHWREFPAEWPPDAATDPAVQDRLRDALDELPATWRDVVLDRDGQDAAADPVSAAHDLTPAQERAILNRARAQLRERLANLFEGRRR
jgi:RNA polymerase sigma-70 factor, ECF subfamily